MGDGLMELFPLSFTLDGKSYTKTKAIADPNGTVVYVWDPQARTGVSVYETHAQPVEQRKDHWLIGEVEATKTCTCSGGRLKNWRPTGGAARVHAV